MYATGSGSGGFFRKLLFWGAVVIGVPVLAVGMASLLRPSPTPAERERDEPSPAPRPVPQEPPPREEPPRPEPTKVEEKKPAKTEEKPAKVEEKKPSKTEEKKPAKVEEEKPAKAEEKKPAKTEEKKADTTSELEVKLKPDKGAQVDGVLVDLDLDGATVRTDAELKKGTIVQLVLPSKKRGKGLSLAGSVSANSGGQVTVTFASLNKGLKTRLEKFLESHNAK